MNNLHTQERHNQENHGHDGHGGRHTPNVLTIRLYSGLSGDMFLAGLLRMTGLNGDEIPAIMPELSGAVSLVRREMGGIGGWHAEVSLPHQHEHRTLEVIESLIAQSGMKDAAKRLACDTFTLLARAEASVHGKAPGEIHFHEVGALDSILDICLTCELFTLLAPDRLVVSPLPLADGSVSCAHGVLPVPAPAVLELLEGVPVRPFAGEGETVTPTALALLKSLGAEFGPWPSMTVTRRALVYGTRVFPNAPNGAAFAFGPQSDTFEPYRQPSEDSDDERFQSLFHRHALQGGDEPAGQAR